VALPLVATEDEIHAVMRRARHSRYPVYGSSLDDIVGVFLARDLRQNDRGVPFALARHLREPVFVPDTRPAHLVVDDLRKARARIAIVLDEVGGTAGIVTMVDLMTQAAGDPASEPYGAQRRRAGGTRP
jgi:CBS domain containing-hemolysin-like protein